MCGYHRSALDFYGNDRRLFGVNLCGVTVVSVVVGFSCGGYQRRGCWCAHLTSTSVFFVIVKEVLWWLGIKGHRRSCAEARASVLRLKTKVEDDTLHT